MVQACGGLGGGTVFGVFFSPPLPFLGPRKDKRGVLTRARSPQLARASEQGQFARTVCIRVLSLSHGSVLVSEPTTIAPPAIQELIFFSPWRVTSILSKQPSRTTCPSSCAEIFIIRPRSSSNATRGETRQNVGATFQWSPLYLVPHI